MFSIFFIHSWFKLAIFLLKLINFIGQILILLDKLEIGRIQIIDNGFLAFHLALDLFVIWLKLCKLEIQLFILILLRRK